MIGLGSHDSPGNLWHNLVKIMLLGQSRNPVFIFTSIAENTRDVSAQNAIAA